MLMSLADSCRHGVAHFAARRKASAALAWEWPEYSNVVAAQKFTDGSYNFASAFSAPAGNINKIVFTKGGGLSLDPGGSGFTQILRAGFLGIYTGATSPPEFDLTSPTPTMRWAMVSDSLTSFVRTDPGAINERYDLIQAEITEATGDPVSRHFKSAVSGGKSSSVLNKRRELVVAFSVLQGAVATTAIGATVP